jgi:hypothetical protein
MVHNAVQTPDTVQCCNNVLLSSDFLIEDLTIISVDGGATFSSKKESGSFS